MSGNEWGVITEADVPALAAAILDPKRQRPVIVVTTPQYTDPHHIPQVTLDEAAELRSAIGDIADVAIVATGGISFALEAALPEHWHIFNGACRSYPAGILADPDIRRSPLRRRRRGEVASEQLINDALRHANAVGMLEASPKNSVAATGTVKGFLSDGEQALIDFGAQLPAVIWRDMISPGIPLDWAVEKDAVLAGELDRDHNRFMPRKRLFGAADFLEAFPHGSVTLALVDHVTPDRATLRIHPDLAIAVHRSDVSSNPLDVLELLLVEGEVVRARAVHLSTGKLHLRLSDVDENEPVTMPVSIVEGGTPWLREGRNLPSTEAPPIEEPRPDDGEAQVSFQQQPPDVPPAASSAQQPAPILATSGDNKSVIQSMSMKITALESEVDRLQRESQAAPALRQELDLTKRALRDAKVALGDAQESIANFRNLHKKAVEELRKARRAPTSVAVVDGPRQRRENWPNDELWLRHEIERAWIERVPRVDKERLPLPTDYLIGPRFADSLTSLDDKQFDKAMKCVVDVLTDRAKDLASRDVHRLRTGDGGSDAPRVRAEDGAIAWRAAVEINAASARRLHYWAIGNRIELSQVGIHDDMQA